MRRTVVILSSMSMSVMADLVSGNSSDCLSTNPHQNKCACQEFASRENVYLQALLEAGCLVLGIFGDGGVRAAAFTRPRLPGAAVVPVLVGGLLDLSPHLHGVLRVGLHQTLGGEQTKVSHREKEGENTEVKQQVFSNSLSETECDKLFASIGKLLDFSSHLKMDNCQKCCKIKGLPQVRCTVGKLLYQRLP